MGGTRIGVVKFAGLLALCGCQALSGCRHAESATAANLPQDVEAQVPALVAPGGVVAEPGVESPKLAPDGLAILVAGATGAPLAMSPAEALVDPVPEVELAMAAVQPAPYRLRIGDQLEISVLDEPEMSRSVSVIPDGTITYLLIGEVPAAGRTIAELREALATALSEYVVDPKVSVITGLLAEEELTPAELAEPEYVSIIGALRSPGKYRMTKDYRLIDLIADAGGMLYTQQEFGSRVVANLKAAYLSRNGQIMPVDFDRLLRLGDMAQNIKLQSHDFIYVPDADASSVYVLGEVNQPRPIPFTRDLSLVEVIASCGGLTQQAQRSGVLIVRPSTGTNFEINLERLLLGQEELNLPLESGDIIFVPEQGLSEYSRYARYLSDFAGLILDGYQVREAIRFPKLKRGEAP